MLLKINCTIVTFFRGIKWYSTNKLKLNKKTNNTNESWPKPTNMLLSLV